jgi:hypothetical protein
MVANSSGKVGAKSLAPNRYRTYSQGGDQPGPSCRQSGREFYDTGDLAVGTSQKNHFTTDANRTASSVVITEQYSPCRLASDIA